MNNLPERHVPSAQYVAALEERLVAAHRAHASLARRMALPRSLFRRRGVRTALTLIAGLVVGAGTVVASAQVQSNQQRDSLMTAIDSKRIVASLRLEIANANLTEVLKGVNVGVRAESDGYNAKHDVIAAQSALRRVDLELEEVRATSAAPRDELWAPLVGGRDFVTERLRVEAGVMVDKVSQSSERMSRLSARLRAGIANEPSDADMELSYAQVESDANVFLITQKMEMRDQFLHGKLGEKEIATRLSLLEAQQALRLLVTKVQLATARAKRAKDRAAVGVGSVIDVKRAELDVLEGTQDLERVREQVKRLQAAQAAMKKG